MTTFNRRKFLRAGAALPIGLGLYATTGISNALAQNLPITPHSGMLTDFSGVTTTTGTNWMQQNIATLGNRTLRQLCMPGSHDSGMSEWASGTTGSARCNTLTQTHNVLNQLKLGARYFDIRPVITKKNKPSGEFRAGHYSKVVGFWQGANGQTIQSIIENVNEYTKDNKELIILRLSHDLNTELGDTNYRALNQTEWNALFDQLIKGLNNRYVAPPILDGNGKPKALDLTKDIKLNQFIQDENKNPRAAVVVIVDPNRDNDALPGADTDEDRLKNYPLITLTPRYQNKGFYFTDAFDVYDVYSNTAVRDNMTSDQFVRLEAERKIKNPPNYFLLSWTMTQQPHEVVYCTFGDPDNGDLAIKTFANWANAELNSIPKKCAELGCIPNILYIDNFLTKADRDEVKGRFPYYYDVPDIVNVVMDINKLPIAKNT